MRTQNEVWAISISKGRCCIDFAINRQNVFQFQAHANGEQFEGQMSNLVFAIYVHVSPIAFTKSKGDSLQHLTLKSKKNKTQLQ